MNTVIEWFARNRVAANLLMALVVVGGVVQLGNMHKEVFPEFSSDLITVTVPYLGAAPEEVETAVVTRIEEAVQGLETVKRVRSVAAEGAGTVTIELLQGTDVREALDDVKTRVDAISTFPEETEKPIIQEILIRRKVLSVAVSGDADERSLKRLGERIRDDLATLPGITQVELKAARPYEVSVEVSEDDLRRHGLTFDQVVRAVRRSSLDLPGGSIETAGGEILLRTEGQAYRSREFERLVLMTRPDGTRLTLGEVATVIDGFADTDQAARFDGQPAVLVEVFRVGDQDATEVADKVKAYLEEARARVPDGIGLTVWQDDTITLRDRLDTLYRNGRAGLFLVVLVLTLFLRLRLAFWVTVGIAVSFLGAFWLIPPLGLTINLVSLFAFIVVLGIVVDDAIVVGENVYRHHEMGKNGVEAAIAGTQEVAMPVLFSILTTIAAFAPLLMVTGSTGKVMRVIPLIVISVLIFSLVEALFILPAHVSHLHPRQHGSGGGVRGLFRRLQAKMTGFLDATIHRFYRPLLERALEWRYVTLAIAVALLLVTIGLVAGGRIQFSFFPPIAGDNVVAFVTMPQGTPEETTAAALAQIESAARELERELEQRGEKDIFRHLLVSLGEQPFRAAQTRIGTGSGGGGSHLGEVNIELAPSEERTLDAEEIGRRWSELTGPVPDAVEVSFDASLFSAGDPINVQLSGPDIEELRRAAEELKDELGRYPGVFEIADSFRAGKRELKLHVTPEAEAMGLHLEDVARQVRQAFYGAEAQRIQRGRDDVRVMVRYPESDRRSLASLEQMRIRTPDGAEVPFSVAGRVELGRGYAAIERTDRNRTVTVTADVDPKLANSNEVLADVERNVLPRLLADYPGLRYSFEGEQQQQRETIGGLQRAIVLALFVIYALLAVPFRSYLQPLIVMTAIPFGVIGAVLGHLLLGKVLTVLSFFGIVALTGVVVNDSLVLVDFINREYRAGVPLLQAIRDAGTKRFRPIVLTSVTTFAGLTPLLLERSLQAQFLIPMAISLAFGVLFATGIILLLVPVGYHILEDLKDLGRRVLGREAAAEVGQEA